MGHTRRQFLKTTALGAGAAASTISFPMVSRGQTKKLVVWWNRGYYKEEEKTRARFVTIEGTRWVLPGDRATIEADGRITVFGRGSGCINTGGEKVFPEEVEEVLKSHPDVFDALVVGIDDERWMQRVVAIVEPRAGRAPSLEELQAYCRNHIAGYKVPRQLVLAEKVARFPTGKPDYVWAKEAAARGVGS